MSGLTEWKQCPQGFHMLKRAIGSGQGGVGMLMNLPDMEFVRERF